MANQVTLNDGRVVTLRPEFQTRGLKVRDIVSAKRLVGDDKETLPFALVALYLQINGEGASLDDVMDMDMSEFEAVSNLLPGVSNFLASAQEK